MCRIAFESLYGPFAWAYDWVSRTFFMGQWRVWQRSAIPYLTGNRVLEVGMGTGNMQLDLARAGFEVWGVDASAQMLKQAQRKASSVGHDTNRMRRAKAQNLPFPTGYFGSVLSTFPSEYIADPTTLAEIKRVLEPGGKLVIVPGGWLAPNGAKARALEGVARAVYGYNEGDASDAETIERRLSESEGWYGWIGELRTEMQGAGFDVAARIATNSKGSCLIIIGTASARE